jgi:serine/threonine protein kinase
VERLSCHLFQSKIQNPKSKIGMSYCVAPGCQKPLNPDRAGVCQTCGSQLLLRDRYRPIRLVGKGGFGKTFLAVDEDIPSKPNCAVKQLQFKQGSSGEFKKAIELFYQEAVRLDELGKHPQIPSLLAHFEENGWLYLVQEWVEGQTIAQELKQGGVFTEQQIWELLQDLLPVLQYVHDRQVIHRDIKPANIMRRTSPVTGKSGEGNQKESQLVLIDFGIAKLFSDTALAHTGTIIGTPDYMPPEQTRGKAVPASDLYSLGLTCIHLLTGVSPSILYDLENDCWAWRDYLPTTGLGELASQTRRVRLGKVVDKLLQNAVSRRYQSAAEVLKDMNPQAKQAPPQRAAIQQSPPPAPQPNSLFAKLFHGRETQAKSQDYLVSEVGLNYNKLRDLLAAKKWKEADRETRAVLCQAVGKSTAACLYTNDIEALPCEDLRTIDRLWVKYSSGRFGFSVQSRIYKGAGEDYGKFCEQVGWATYNSHLPESDLQFNFKAPAGHLPSRIWAGGLHWWRHAGAMAARLAEFEIG